MTNATNTDKSDEQKPNKDELWTLLKQGETSRLAVARVTESLGHVEAYDEVCYAAELLYDNYSDLDSISVPYGMTCIPQSCFYAQLPENEMHTQWTHALDYTLGLVTPEDCAELMGGEPSYMTGGRRGYEALRFFILDGFQESITEFSVGHGHGPSRYASAVAQRINRLPETFVEPALQCELERWTGGLGMQPETAAKIVEIRMLMQERLDEDHSEEIRELVAEDDLEYDQFKEEA